MTTMEERMWNTTSSRLYELLQVDPSVPAREIEKTFGSLTLRKQYKSAFDVLRNPDKKRVYDIGGESAVEHLESKMWGSAVAVMGSTLSLYIYGVAWVLTVVLVTLFFIFLPLCVDNEVSNVSWTAVFAPLYILFICAVAGCIVLIIFAFMSTKAKMNGITYHGILIAYRAPIMRLLVSVLYLVFLFLVGLAASADEFQEKPWRYYFIILLIADVVSIVEWWSWKYPRRVARLLEPTGGKKPMMTEKDMVAVKFERTDIPPWNLTWGFTIIAVIDFILAILRNVFLGLRIDGMITSSWYAVMFPVALRFITSALYRLHQNRIMMHLKQKTFCHVLIGLWGTMLLNGALIISTYLIAYKIQEKDLRLVFALIPTYFVLLYFIVAALFTAIYFPIANCYVRDLEEAEARRNKESEPEFTRIHENTRAARYYYPSGSDEEAEKIIQFEDESGVTTERRRTSNAPFDDISDAAHHKPLSSMGTESIVSEKTVVDDTDSSSDVALRIHANSSGGGYDKDYDSESNPDDRNPFEK